MIIDPLQAFGEREWDLAGRPSVVVSPSTGLDHVDRTFLNKQGVRVFGLLDDREALDEIRASSEFTFLLLLLGLRGGPRIFGTRHRGEAGNELYRKLVGIIGFGRIGKNIEHWCDAFGAEVAIYDPHNGYFYWPLERLFRECDAVVVCCSLNDETRHMIGKALLETLKPGAVFVNTSRGAVLVESELIEVLRARPDLRVMLDVLDGETEWRHLNSPLWDLATISAHIAGHTIESEQKAHQIARELENRATIIRDG
mgnify:CR=1 FL=1